MAEQVKMSVPEAIDLLSQKIVDLENTVAAQFMVISVLKFHLEAVMNLMRVGDFQRLPKSL